MAKEAGDAAQFGARLQEIADALGLPISWFHEGQAPPFATETFDLIRLYAAITDAQGRQRVMNLAQREVARCQAIDRSPS